MCTSSNKYIDRKPNLALGDFKKTIKVVFENCPELEMDGNDVKITYKLSEFEIKNIFGTTEMALLDCSGMTDEEIDEIVDAFNAIPEEYIVDCGCIKNEQ